MIGLFQELGPCRIKNDSTGVHLNPTSWTEYANVYVSMIVSNVIHDRRVAAHLQAIH